VHFRCISIESLLCPTRAWSCAPLVSTIACMNGDAENAHRGRRHEPPGFRGFSRYHHAFRARSTGRVSCHVVDCSYNAEGPHQGPQLRPNYRRIRQVPRGTGTSPGFRPPKETLLCSWCVTGCVSVVSRGKQDNDTCNSSSDGAVTPPTIPWDAGCTTMFAILLLVTFAAVYAGTTLTPGFLESTCLKLNVLAHDVQFSYRQTDEQ
jgi:hypothetical protein